MFVSTPFLVVLALGVFVMGTVVGSFLNVCIYRIPWQKSVIWPSSRCPRCLGEIAAQDNIPILSWLSLRGECRGCGEPIAARYPLVEALVGFLFVGAFLIDVVLAPRDTWGQAPMFGLAQAAYHAIFLALLVAATFIDYDLMIIPDQITVTGMIIGIGAGVFWPGLRPEPSHAATALSGLGVGLGGMAAGMLITQGIRGSASFVFRREAMGFGDVTLMGMIGAFLGWRAALITFFLAPFLGLGHAAWKLVKSIGKRIRGGQLSSSDREIPFGPYLSMAAATVLFSWKWLWEGWARGLFGTLYVLFWWMMGVNVDGP